MSALLVGYARCSTDKQDLTAQRDALSGLGVEADRIYVDHGLTGTNPERPGSSVYYPTGAVGRLLFNVLALVAEFESDLIRLRTREGMKVAKAKGQLRGRQPKLNRRQEAHLARWCTGASTAPPTWPNSSASAAPRSTVPSNANASKRELASWRRHRGADTTHGAGCPESNTPAGRRGHANPPGLSAHLGPLTGTAVR